jgi:hypothetical protein
MMKVEMYESPPSINGHTWFVTGWGNIIYSDNKNEIGQDVDLNSIPSSRLNYSADFKYCVVADEGVGDNAILASIGTNPNISPESREKVSALIALSGTLDQCLILAKDRDISERAAKLLSIHPHDGVRITLAGNPHIGEDSLKTLEKDINYEVRKVAIKTKGNTMRLKMKEAIFGSRK